MTDKLPRFTLEEMHAFLDGSAPLDGVWFEEDNPTDRGGYWWRKHLRAAIEAGKRSAPAVSGEAVGEVVGTHKVGFAELATVAWTSQMPTIGTKLYTPPTGEQKIEAVAQSAKERYEHFMQDCEEPDPVERLRFFCSLAMNGQDWVDVEPFFDALAHPTGEVEKDAASADSRPSRLEKLRKDAERYRWLRKRDVLAWKRDGDHKATFETRHEAGLDAAIDSAMNTEAKNG